MVARGRIVHASHPGANIAQTLAGAVLLCFSSQVRGQAPPQTQTFVVHGTQKTCSAITQLDSALSTNSQQFFAGWTETDYFDAVAWSQACAGYGWHVPGRPRLPLLQAQHDRTLRPARTATSDALPNTPVQAAVAAPAQSVPSAAAEGALPSLPVQTAIAAQAQSVPSAATEGALPSSPVQTAIAAPAQPVPSAATVSALPIPEARNETAPDAAGDDLLTDEYYKAHFHQESVWVASQAHLDIGDDRGPSSWPSGRTSVQMANRLTADKIVLYCARKTTSGESGHRPLLWDWRRCEADEASAYNRLVVGNEFPAAGRGIVLGCAGVDSYIYLERCIETLTAGAKP